MSSVNQLQPPKRYCVEINYFSWPFVKVVDVAGVEDPAYTPGDYSPWLGIPLDDVEKYAAAGDYGALSTSVLDQCREIREGSPKETTSQARPKPENEGEENMNETKFIVGDAVRNIAIGKYPGVDGGHLGNVQDVYVSHATSEVVYEVQFANGPLTLVREADLA